MVKLNRKLKAFTLMETLVSMILLMSAFILAFMSVTGIRRSFKNDLRRYSYMVAKQELHRNDTIDIGHSTILFPGFKLEIDKDSVPGNRYISKITVSVISADSSVLYTLSEIVKKAKLK